MRPRFSISRRRQKEFGVHKPDFYTLTSTLALPILLLALSCAASAQGPVITGFLVDGVSSNTGPVGATLTIQGSGFGTTMLWSTVTLDGAGLAGSAYGLSAKSWSPTAIVVVLPQTANSGPVIVTVNSTQSNAPSFYIGAVITSLPNSGLAGTPITINGQGFGTSGIVTFNGVQANTSGLWTSSSIQAIVPTTATEGPVVVTASGGYPSNGVNFTPTPSITSLSTYSGVGGTVVTITGNAFGLTQAAGSSTVTFDGTSAAISNNQWSDTSITAIVPSAGTTGNVVVTVNGVPSAGVMFTYTPSITSLSPNPVLADGAATIGGNYFGAPLSTDQVTFNGVAGTISSWSNNSVSAIVPSNVTAGNVVVSVNGVSSTGFPYSLTSPYNFSVTYAPNGEVITVNDSVNGNWDYAYDGFNRLSCSNLSSNGSCSSPTSGTPTYSYAYDRYGNRWQQNGPTTMLLTFSKSQNQMDGYSYDAAGNLLNDGNHSYTYDAENRIIEVDGGQTATYVYDGDGQRVQKTAGGVVAEYLYDLDGNTITELNSSGVWTRGEVYVGGVHLATYGNGSSGTTYFIQQDWLGTERSRVLPDGDMFETCTSLPFGDDQICSGSGDPSPNHFTGKQRDTESNLDYFGARHYISAMGRFMQPDWAARPISIPYAVFGDPQSLNLYGYVRNDPVTRADADGHCPSSSDNCPEDADVSGNVSARDASANAQTSQQSGQDAQNKSKTGQYAKGGAKILLGVGLIATVAVGDVPGGVAGGAIVASAIIGATTTTVSGVADVAGAATNTDVHEAQEALDATSNLPGLATTAASGGNLKAGQTAATIGDAAQLAISPREATKNVATAVDAGRTVFSVADSLKSTWASFSSAVSGLFAPSPAPPVVQTAPGLP